jgi:hypothetical protein
MTAEEKADEGGNMSVMFWYLCPACSFEHT